MKLSEKEEEEHEIDDITFSLLYQPRPFSLLFFGFLVLVYLAFSSQALETISNVKNGVIAVIFCALLFSTIALPNGVFTRPHPVVWRLILGISICYWLFLVFLMFQSVTDARKLLNNTSNPTAPILKEYASDCSITLHNLWEGIFDIYFVAHFIGWVLKALMIRDLYILWICSFLWEMMELSFLHMLPNFAECWWDSYIFDVTFCNGLGILIGLKICDYLEMREYKWSNILEIETTFGKLKRAFLQFTPVSWTKVEWKSTSNFRKYCLVILLIFGIQIVELNAFFLKHVLYLPSADPLNIYRLIIWWLCGCPAIREIYLYITDEKYKRLGTQAWVVLFLIFTEVLICVKFGEGMFEQVWPHRNVLYGWGIGLTLFGIFSVLAFKFRKYHINFITREIEVDKEE